MNRQLEVLEKPIEVMNGKERLKGLFLSLQERIGYGKPYTGRIKQYPWEFTFQRIRSDGRRCRVAISEQPHLITVVFFSKANHWWHRLHQWFAKEIMKSKKDLDPQALTMYAGKLCPPSEHHFYPDTFEMKLRLPTHHRFFVRFPIEGIIAEIGVHSDVEDMYEYCSKGFSHFSFCFQNDPRGEILLPSKHTWF